MSHITLERLSQYIGGRLSEEQREEVEGHLADCDKCREEFTMAIKLMQDKSLHQHPADAPKFLSGVGALVSALADRLRDKLGEWQSEMTPPAWAFQQVRSSGHRPQPHSGPEAAFFQARMGIATLEVYAEKLDARHMRLCLKAFRQGSPLSNTEVALQREGGGKSARILRRETDFFEKKRLPFGTYHLSLKYEGQPLGTHTFQIDKTGIYEEEDAVS